MVKKFPFRIRTIRTDRGHEFQVLYHWHVADQGMEHVYIKPRMPQNLPSECLRKRAWSLTVIATLEEFNDMDSMEVLLWKNEFEGCG